MLIKYKSGGKIDINVGKENPRTYTFNPICDVSSEEDIKLLLEHAKTKDMFEKAEARKESSDKEGELKTPLPNSDIPKVVVVTKKKKIIK